MKPGFVYLWKDSKRNKYYLGSHSGLIDDGYIGSNRQLLSAVKSRPETFRRRILEYYKSCSNKFIRDRETAWLSLIKPEELDTKYYNLKSFASGGDIYNQLSPEKRRIARLKSNSKIRKLIKENIHIDKAEQLVNEENVSKELNKKKPGETWTNRKHSEESKLKQSIYRKKNPSVRLDFSHSKKSKLLVQLNNPNRKSIKTPFGNFYSAEDFCKINTIITPNGLRLLFKNLDLPITQRRAERCPLLTIDNIGNTMRELGYSYIEDKDVN